MGVFVCIYLHLSCTYISLSALYVCEYTERTHQKYVHYGAHVIQTIIKALFIIIIIFTFSSTDVIS